MTHDSRCAPDSRTAHTPLRTYFDIADNLKKFVTMNSPQNIQTTKIQRYKTEGKI